MDSALAASATDHYHRAPPPLPPDRASLVDVTPPPPPRHPLPRRDTDTPRPCPPPPLPARQPISVDRRPPHHVPPAADAPPRPLQHSSALDSVVPLAHWPLRSVGPPVTLDKPPTSTHHVTLDDCTRRGGGGGHGLALPVNMLVVTPTPPTMNHVVTTTPVTQTPKPCSNGRGNLYVDSPTIGRGGTGLVSSGQNVDRTAATTDCRLTGTTHSTTQSPAPLPPTVKFNPVVQTNVGGTGGLAGSEKAGAVVVGQPRSAEGRVCRGGIMCQRCGRCRCANCTAPRELPRRWMGDCECSVQRCVAVTSCLCCIEALFYHCLDGADADDGGTGGAADDPCACCERPRCCLRWSLMVGLAASVLPCLCCYCPLQTTADAMTTCYNSCASPRGCRCSSAAGAQEASSGSSTRGLLAESESSST